MIVITSLILAVAASTVTAIRTEGAAPRPTAIRTERRLLIPYSHAGTRRRPFHRPARRPAHTTDANDPDAFLRKQAFTVSELSTQIDTDTRARATYARYFRSLPGEALQKIQPQPSADRRFLSLLTSASLPEAGVYTEYRRHSNGVVYPVKVTLPKGTRVFHTPDRSFELLAGSGDPIVPYAVVTNTITVPAPAVEIITPAAPTEIIQQAPVSAPAPPSSSPAPAR